MLVFLVCNPADLVSPVSTSVVATIQTTDSHPDISGVDQRLKWKTKNKNQQDANLPAITWLSEEDWPHRLEALQVDPGLGIKRHYWKITMCLRCSVIDLNLAVDPLLEMGVRQNWSSRHDHHRYGRINLPQDCWRRSRKWEEEGTDEE